MRGGGGEINNVPNKNVPFYGRGEGLIAKGTNFTLYLFGGRP